MDSEEKKNHQILSSLIDLINQAVGDALSDMLLCEAILIRQKWSLEDWANIYTDLPSRQLKVKVKDRSIFETRDADRYLTSPPGLQSELDALVSHIPQGRSFVR